MIGLLSYAFAFVFYFFCLHFVINDFSNSLNDIPSFDGGNYVFSTGFWLEVCCGFRLIYFSDFFTVSTYFFFVSSAFLFNACSAESITLLYTGVCFGIYYALVLGGYCLVCYGTFTSFGFCSDTIFYEFYYF